MRKSPSSIPRASTSTSSDACSAKADSSPRSAAETSGRRRELFLGHRRRRDVDDIARFHAAHLRAHDAAHHLQVAVFEEQCSAGVALEDEPRVHAMIHHGLKLEEYRAFLHDLYDIVWHFCPAMAAAAARCGDEFRNVRYALYERIEEEKEHETWVLEDVGAVGGDVAGAKADPPSAPVQAMIAFNYHGAERVHPCSVLGMLYMLEVVSSVYGGGYRTRSRALG